MDPQRLPRGFSLIEIVVVLVIFGLVATMASALLRSFTAVQKRSVTATRLAGVDAAIVQFVMLQRRLPCPADGSSSAGTEVRNPGGNCQPGNQANGVVPWVTLGISPVDATDGWDRRITYRAAIDLVKTNGMDLSWCDPAGTGNAPGGVCNPGCVAGTPTSCTPPATYITNKGLSVRNVAGTTLMDSTGVTGAAYVLISHGESGGGAFLPSGAQSPGTSTDGTEEQKNYANLVLATYYVDDQLAEVAGTAHYDDLVLRPTILGVAMKASLAPRAH